MNPFDSITISENLTIKIQYKISVFDSVTSLETIAIINPLSTLLLLSVFDSVIVTEFHNEVIPRVVIRYLLNETSGTTVTDSIAGNNGTIKVSGAAYYPFDGNALDISVNGSGVARLNNGTVTGATLTTDKWGNANSAYNFVATSGTANTISIPSAAMPHTGFISMWIQPLGDGIADPGGTIAFFNSNLDTRTRLFWSNTGGGNSSGTMRLVKGSGATTTGGYLATWGTWYHVVATWNATTLKAQFYVNGSQVGADITYADTTTAGTSNLIGSFNAGTGLNGSWTGKIQDVFIGQTYPTAAEILALYNTTAGSKLNKPFGVGTIDGGYNMWGQDGAASSSAGVYIDGGTYVSSQIRDQDPWTIEYRTIPNSNSSGLAGVGWYGGNYLGPYMHITNTGAWAAVIGQGTTTGANSNLNLSGSIGFTPTTWLYVVMRYDGAYIDVFVNNVLLTHTLIGLLIDNGAGAQRFKVNGNPWDNNRLGAAKYDNVAVYSYALSNSEIANNYTQSYTYEGITVSENVSININVSLNVSDTVITTESSNVINYLDISISDTITITEGPLTIADIPGGNTADTSPGLITSVSAGGMPWRTPYTNMYTRNGVSQFTDAAIDGASDIARGSSFGFNIPEGVTITGISLTVARPGTGGATPYYDNIASLYKSDGTLTVNKVTGASIGGGPSVKTFTYGGSTDLWGESWTPADINSPEFGFAYSIRWGGFGDTGNGRFDGGSITVYYAGVVGGTYPEVHVVSNLLISDDVTVTDFADDQTAPLEVNVYENVYTRDWLSMYRPPIAYDAPEYVPYGDTYQITPFGETGLLPSFMDDSGSGY